ncbi:MAG: T9SS type A sorting domain-containing protein [Flavobacteriales bacterium]|nr:T9SS type A sorting domain-containing protein [Flavobacteriales bacterium]
MKKIYFLAVAAIFSTASFAQVSEQGNAIARDSKTINLSKASTKTPTDTVSWTPGGSAKWLPGEFAVGGQVWNYGYTGGGYVYGVNISTNEINQCAQGYLNLNAASFGVEGILAWFTGKTDNSGGNSNITFSLWTMAANAAFSHDGTNWNQDYNGPSTQVASTSLNITAIDTVWPNFTWAPFSSVATISGSDFAASVDGTAAKAANDTIGLISDADGEGYRYAFHRVAVASNNWYVTDDLFGGLDNNIAIWPVIDENFVGVEDVEFFNGMQLSAFPNPVVDQTTISYNLEHNMTAVKLVVYDMTGKEVFTQNFGGQAQGSYNVAIDASEFTAGNYFYSLIADNNRLTKRMVVTK